ncbi:hypothetical protein N307_04999, partial [Dryobates pubescens]
WLCDWGQRLEIFLPFLGTSRPLLRRCCQTCTPRSWDGFYQQRFSSLSFRDAIWVTEEDTRFRGWLVRRACALLAVWGWKLPADTPGDLPARICSSKRLQDVSSSCSPSSRGDSKSSQRWKEKVLQVLAEIQAPLSLLLLRSLLPPWGSPLWAAPSWRDPRSSPSSRALGWAESCGWDHPAWELCLGSFQGYAGILWGCVGIPGRICWDPLGMCGDPWEDMLGSFRGCVGIPGRICWDPLGMCGDLWGDMLGSCGDVWGSLGGYAGILQGMCGDPWEDMLGSCGDPWEDMLGSIGDVWGSLGGYAGILWGCVGIPGRICWDPVGIPGRICWDPVGMEVDFLRVLWDPLEAVLGSFGALLRAGTAARIIFSCPQEFAAKTLTRGSSAGRPPAKLLLPSILGLCPSQLEAKRAEIWGPGSPTASSLEEEEEMVVTELGLHSLSAPLFLQGVLLSRLMLDFAWLLEELLLRQQDVGFSGQLRALVQHSLSLLRAHLTCYHLASLGDVLVVPKASAEARRELSCHSAALLPALAREALGACAIRALLLEMLPFLGAPAGPSGVVLSEEELCHKILQLLQLLPPNLLGLQPCQPLDCQSQDIVDKLLLCGLLEVQE